VSQTRRTTSQPQGSLRPDLWTCRPLERRQGWVALKALNARQRALAIAATIAVHALNSPAVQSYLVEVESNMFVISWNIQGKPEARVALYQYLEACNTVGVIFVQEWVPYGERPEDVLQVQRDVEANTGGLFTVAGINHDSRLVTIISSILRARAPRVSDHLLSHTIGHSTEQWGALRIVNVHARSRAWADRDEERSYHMGQLITNLALHWKSGPAVIAGDFNAQPYENEIVSPTQLGAFRERLEVVHQNPKPVHREGEALYNPCWSLLPDPVSGEPAGTYFHPLKSRGLQWYCFDQILVNSDLAEHISTVCRLVSLGNHTPKVNGRPSPRSLSDHVAIQATIAIKEVTACQTS